jgi:hypothetical protein
MDKDMQPTMTIDNAGNKCWWLNNRIHREDGPAIESANGHKSWYLYGDCHRIDGPAIEYADGDAWWYSEGKLHRADGPAVEYADGRKGWWLHSTHLSFNEWLDQNKTLTDEEKVMFKLQYG